VRYSAASAQNNSGALHTRISSRFFAKVDILEQRSLVYSICQFLGGILDIIIMEDRQLSPFKMFSISYSCILDSARARRAVGYSSMSWHRSNKRSLYAQLMSSSVTYFSFAFNTNLASSSSFSFIKVSNNPYSWLKLGHCRISFIYNRLLSSKSCSAIKEGFRRL